MQKVVDSEKDKTIIATRQDKTRQDKTRQDKLILIGIIDQSGYELENRVYSIQGIAPTVTAGVAKINILAM